MKCSINTLLLGRTRLFSELVRCLSSFLHTKIPNTFKAIPAIFRFNVSNNTDSDMVLESVKITCNKLFPDKLRWTTNGKGMSVREPADKSGYFNTIKTSINWGHGETIPAPPC